MRVAVVVFPGTNCDQDVLHVFGKLLNAEAYPVWHRDTDLQKPDLVVLPGGFSYGDYLRTGALAKLSPVMESVKDFASNGGRVLGICNGFQILCEAGLLPGVLLENVGSGIEPGKVITCPIAHFQGNYYADEATLKEIEANGQVVFRYSDAQGNVSPDDRSSNVNGSCHAIAGIANKAGNVVGLMPHPERAAEALVGFVGGDTGLAPFRVAVSA